MGVDVAGADRLMMIHKVSIIQSAAAKLRRADSGDRGRDARHPRQLVRRLLPGAEPTSCRAWLSTRRPGCRCIRSSSCRRIRRRPGSPTAPERSSAPISPRGTGGRSATACRCSRRFISGRTRAPWEFTIDGIYDSTKQGVDKTQFFFQFEYLNEAMRKIPGLADQVGWYVVPRRRSIDVGSAREDESTRCSPTHRRKQRRQRRRRSSPTSPSRSATSAAS